MPKGRFCVGVLNAILTTTVSATLASCSASEAEETSTVPTEKVETPSPIKVGPKELTDVERASYRIEDLVLGMTYPQVKTALLTMRPAAQITEEKATLPNGDEYVEALTSSDGGEELHLKFSSPGSGNKLYQADRVLHADESTGPGFVTDQLLANLREKFGDSHWSDPKNELLLHWGQAIGTSGRRVPNCPREWDDAWEAANHQTRNCGLNAAARLQATGDPSGKFSNNLSLTMVDWTLIGNLQQQDRVYVEDLQRAVAQEELGSAEEAPAL